MRTGRRAAHRSGRRAAHRSGRRGGRSNRAGSCAGARVAGSRGRSGRRISSFNGSAGQAPPVCQIVGYKNSGKTTLICALLPYLSAHGCKVGVIKHDAHDFEADREHTDTWRHRQAGAAAVAITSPHRTALIEERRSTLTGLLAAMAPYDYVLVEGFKAAGYPKVVLLRTEQDLPLLEAPNAAAAAVWPGNDRLAAAVRKTNLRLFSIDDTAAIAEWLWQQRFYFQNFNI
ncbi:molybdopterin-guanine dinucleotide biosynthesis protein B [Paenibacillus tengchongensis]|uniref:molybdopterin-guanine dinucleotide biosynthesis protein B n=1 Tax=Paenibacillus tengchongensis TaxID=2608684 RepID=UPI00124BDD83|nr:molybdopterin-guanine dinucleotide biosynthesis protein B [Paenibacillus tengchongensis]